MDGCEAKRCVPDAASAFACDTDADCYDGQTCSDGGKCISCNEYPAGSDSSFFSAGACHQLATPGGGGVPSFAEGESGLVFD